ncbi:MAG: type II toxin-antitoxin system RelE/ParE family toxin [Nitrospinae bacterium]|nr:type II toxin-antitoxin system RelE/ParE family toxin [Nitrospinota bacterium]
MVKVIWSEQALDDVESICFFISRDSIQYAKSFAAKAFEAADQLALFPKHGRKVPEINKEEIREVILGNYRIIHRVTATKVVILTIHHGARLLDTAKLD